MVNMSEPSLQLKSRLHWLLIIAALSYIPALGFYYVGEEAIQTISSLEMWHRGEWVRQVMYGANQQHNPFYNWLIIPCASLLGWDYVLLVTRTITVIATLTTAAILTWLARHLMRDETQALFAALVYLTMTDVALYRGWLAYVDPLFGMFVFGSIAALWVACIEKRPNLLVVAALSLTCAFMSKAFTAYVFYASGLFVLAFTPAARRILLSRYSITVHLLALLAPIAWLGWVPSNSGQGGRMFDEILAKLIPEGVFDYIWHLLAFIAEAIIRISPAFPLAVFYGWKQRATLFSEPVLLVSASITALFFLPYWISPQSAARYLMPMYPLAAFVCAAVLWGAGARAIGASMYWFTGMITVKIIVLALIFPWYQSHYRGENYAIAAREIIAQTDGYPLYINDVSASGLSVAAYIDAFIHPTDPIQRPPAEWESGFVIAYEEDPRLGRTFKHYKLAANSLYLLCRGAACAVAR